MTNGDGAKRAGEPSGRARQPVLSVRQPYTPDTSPRKNRVFCYAATILAQYFTQVYLIFFKSDGLEPSCYTVGQKNVTALL